MGVFSSSGGPLFAPDSVLVERKKAELSKNRETATSIIGAFAGARTSLGESRVSGPQKPLGGLASTPAHIGASKTPGALGTFPVPLQSTFSGTNNPVGTQNPLAALMGGVSRALIGIVGCLTCGQPTQTQGGVVSTIGIRDAGEGMGMGPITNPTPRPRFGGELSQEPSGAGQLGGFHKISPELLGRDEDVARDPRAINPALLGGPAMSLNPPPSPAAKTGTILPYGTPTGSTARPDSRQWKREEHGGAAFREEPLRYAGTSYAGATLPPVGSPHMNAILASMRRS